ncbi:MAG: T9SS type A sorting domain-containing protein [bacterium]
MSNTNIGTNKLITADAVMILLNRRLSPMVVTAVNQADRSTTVSGTGTFSIFPNPFNAATNFFYSSTTSGHVSMELFDTLGRRVAILADGDQLPGEHQLQFDASKLGSGMYIARLSTASRIEIQKLLIIR